MSSKSTFSETPAYSGKLESAKEVASEEALIYEELRKAIAQLESVVKTNAKEKLARLLRTTSKLRQTLSVAQLNKAISQALPDTNPSKKSLLSYLSNVETKVNATTDVSMEAVKTEDVESIPSSDTIEVEIYLSLFVLAALIKYSLSKEALDATLAVVQRCEQFNRRTLDVFQAKAYSYYVNAREQFASSRVELSDLRPILLAAHRTACLRYDETGQATLMNLVLRSYLRDKLYDQAYKFISKTSFPESVSNNQFVRYLYYVGKVQAIQLEYPEAHTKLLQSIRKAPQNTALGFRRTVHKLAVIVQLLMGDVPERSVFDQEELRVALRPYFQLSNAVRVGNLVEFNQVLGQHVDQFRADDTHSLILRLRHNVIKTGLRKIATSYSRIQFSDICDKLALETPQNAEFVCAKAIKDGVIDATIDHAQGWLQSKDSINVYTTMDPQLAFQRRITFCLDVHNEAVRGMRYPPDAYKKDLESAEERLEREKQEEELAKEIEDEMDEGL